jgi:RNA polymerase sigma-70 factor (ECF subfamily)
MPLTEQQLVDRAKAGDRQAMGELLHNYHNRLYNVALRMVNALEDAADVTQEAMMKVVQHLREFDGKSQLSTWMIRITMNLSISHLRKRKLRKTASLDSTASAGDEGLSGGGGEVSTSIGQRVEDVSEPLPDQCVQENEMLADMHAAMDRIDEEFRAILVMRDINEMDYRDIAQVLEVPAGTVKSRLFRARMALRQEMAKTYPELRT